MYNQLIDLLLTGTTDTLIMVGVSAILAFVIGLPIALILVSTADFGIYPSKKINQSLGTAMNQIKHPLCPESHRTGQRSYRNIEGQSWVGHFQH